MSIVVAVATQAPLSLELTHRFDASPERVFEAWLSKEWGDWLPPANARVSIVRWEPVVGGSFLLVMTMEDGHKTEISGRYRVVDPPNRLVFTWLGVNKQEMLITLTFAKCGEGTLMKLRQEGFKDAESRDRFNTGWIGVGGSFDKLNRMLCVKQQER